MSKPAEVKLPLRKPYFEKFLTGALRLSADRRYALSSTDFLGPMILLSLRTGKHPRSTFKINYPHHITIVIQPGGYLWKNGRYLSDDKIVIINNWIWREVYRSFFLFMDVRAKHDEKQYQEAVDEFMEAYALSEDDIPKETLVKEYYRYRADPYYNIAS
ncbi:MAG TPA: hypothetical protein VI757_11845 [Bacteroidia bacterium]|nr:hypothetical protein [Bacteroidia bacterium]